MKLELLPQSIRTKQELIEYRQDPLYEDLRPVFRRALKYIERLEREVYRLRRETNS